MVSCYKALRMMKDKRVKNSTQQDDTKQEDKTDTKIVNYRSGNYQGFEKNLLLFLNYFTRQHLNISFTSELAKDGNLAQTVTFLLLFIVNPLSLVFSLIPTASFLLPTSALYFHVYYIEFLTSVPAMITFMFNLKLSGNCLT